MKVAHTIEIDAEKGAITIDGLVFPYYVMPDPEVELTASDVAGAPAVVHLGIIANNVTYRSKDGVKVLAQADTDTERRWAAARGREIVLLGLADTIEWLEEAEVQRQARAETGWGRYPKRGMMRHMPASFPDVPIPREGFDF